MYPDKLTPSERRSVIGLLFMIAVGGLITFFIKIANDSDWGENQWSGVSAIANWVEALAVLGALVYAGVQLRAAKESDVQRRQADLVDRLDRVVHEELAPAVNRLVSAARSLDWDVETYKKQAEATLDQLAVVMLFGQNQSELAPTLEAFQNAMQNARRVEVPIDDQHLREALAELQRASLRVFRAAFKKDIEEFDGRLVNDEVRTLIDRRLDEVLRLTRGHMKAAGPRAGG